MALGYGVSIESNRLEDHSQMFQLTHICDFKLAQLVAILPNAWRLGISILWLGEIASLIYNFYLSAAACTFVYADFACFWDAKIKKQQHGEVSTLNSH